jgi:hypothetical protein
MEITNENSLYFSVRDELLHAYGKRGEKLPSVSSNFNVNELIRLSKEMYSLFGIVVLLIKNSFEFHIKLEFDVSSEKVKDPGVLIRYRMVPSFLNKLPEYVPGIISGINLCDDKSDFKHISACCESMIYWICAQSLYKFPVSFSQDFDIHSVNFTDRKRIHHDYDLVRIGEEVLCDYLNVLRINYLYKKEFEDILLLHNLKNEIFGRYQLKLQYAETNPSLSQEELESLMYDQLLKEKLTKDNERYNLRSCRLSEMHTDDMEQVDSDYLNPVKRIFRLIAKSSKEIQTEKQGVTNEHLNVFKNMFWEAYQIYEEPVTTEKELVFFSYLRLVQILSDCLVFRKTIDLEDIVHLSDLVKYDFDFKLPDTSLVRQRLKQKTYLLMTIEDTDKKTEYLKNEHMIAMHRLNLQQEVEMIDETIQTVKEKIEAILQNNLPSR